MGDVWNDNFFNLGRCSHFGVILIVTHDKLKPPKSVRMLAKSPTNSRTMGITKETEFFWEE